MFALNPHSRTIGNFQQAVKEHLEAAARCEKVKFHSRYMHGYVELTLPGLLNLADICI